MKTRSFIVIAIISFIISLTLMLTLPAYAEEKSFDILDYNKALTEYESGRYATAYNILLDEYASQKIINIFFPVK